MALPLNAFSIYLWTIIMDVKENSFLWKPEARNYVIKLTVVVLELIVSKYSVPFQLVNSLQHSCVEFVLAPSTEEH